MSAMANGRISRVLVSGSSGLVGSALVPLLKAGGMRIARLTRPGATPREAPDEEQVLWDPAKAIAPDAVSGFDAVIHLAGESIVGRWTAAKKARIRNSRIAATQFLSQSLAESKVKPSAFVSASAIGYYGHRGDEVLTEQSGAGTGFAADLAREWEAATAAAEHAGIRTAQMRIGIVMGTHGGALPQMLPAFKIGLGGRLGSGTQWMSWVDVRDVAAAIQHVLKTDSLRGPINLAAPNPVTNAEFSRILARVLSRPAAFPMPAFVARLAFGEMADELLLASQRIDPAKLVRGGYSFQFGELRPSLETLLQKP